MIFNLLGNLVSQLGLTQALAFAIVTALTTYGGAVVAVMFPIIAPFVATLQGMLVLMGAAYVVGW